MKTIIGYELKKFFQSKLFVGAFIICLVAMVVISALNVHQYSTGTNGIFSLSMMNGEKAPEVFVSNQNISELKRIVDNFENRDEIYYKNSEEQQKDYPQGSSAYYGKYSVNSDLSLKLLQGEITQSEYDALVSNTEKKAIKKEYLPEYFKLCWGVKNFESLSSNISWCEFFAKDPESTEYSRKLNAFLAEKNKKVLENGFVSGYDYGWNNFYSMLSEIIGIFLVIIIILGLCSVFTTEYSLSVDAFLLSSKRGRASLVTAKIAASLIYTAICFLVYIFLALIISFSFLGIEGINVGYEESHLTKIFTVLPFVLLGSSCICIITLVISVFCKKQITSIAVSSLVCLFPLIVQLVFHIEDQKFSQILDLLPINMVFGPYIYDINYIFVNGNFTDIRCFFPFVAIVIFSVCIPLIYAKFLRHQVSN